MRHPERQLWRYTLEEKPAHTIRVLPRQWVVERTFAWLSQSRRLSKDYERLPAASEAVTCGAASRLTHTSAPNAAGDRVLNARGAGDGAILAGGAPSPGTRPLGPGSPFLTIS